MNLPKKITIHEVGPREGMQFEKGPISTEAKIQLVDMLSECNFPEIEVTSFVSPKWVPQMADAEQVATGFTRKPGTQYTCIYLNTQGAARAIATGRFDLEGWIGTAASQIFSKKNSNRTIEENFVEAERRIVMFKEHNIPLRTVNVLAAFGCNFEGAVDPDKVVLYVDRLMNMANESGAAIEYIQLADTMGWANPRSIRDLVGKVQKRWPSQRINLHLHDTRGLGLANVVAALEMGVDDFDSAVAGLGGCPYGGFKGAAGNIVTEDLVHMCEELGVETGVDLDRLTEVAREAERIVGHPLPGKVMNGGRLEGYRARAQAA
jgi:hydroxymethylglutaryl-CoA lyase